MHYKVLLVDDEAIVCDGLIRFVNWEELNYEVVATANSVAQALVYLESYAVDLVISDIRMPVQNGLQLLEVIQVEYPSVHTIILSGYGEFEYARQALRLGASDFLTKPVNFSELKKLLVEIREKMEGKRRESLHQQEYMQMHLNNILNSLAKGYINEVKEEQAKLAGLPFVDQDYFIIRIQIQKSFTKQVDLIAIKEQLSQLISQAAEEKGSVWLFDNEINEIACLWIPHLDNRASSNYLEELSNTLEKEQIETILGISDKHCSLAHLKKAYMEAGRALQYAMLHHHQIINRYQEIDQVLLTDHQIDEKLAAEILDLLASPEKWSNIEAIIHSAVDVMNLNGQNTYEIQAFCIQILFMINQHIRSTNNMKSNTNLDSALYASIRSLLVSSEVSQMKDCIASALVRMNHELNPPNQTEKSSHIITNVKRYIDEHYAQDISLTTLSNMFFIHPIYLSRLFKEKMGINYLDYVTDVRITQAKVMLKNPNLKVYEIGQMVGYDSPRYFSKLFKNTTGMTPKEYKEKAF